MVIGMVRSGLRLSLPSACRYHFGPQAILLGLSFGMVHLCAPTVGEAGELTAADNPSLAIPYAFVDRFQDSTEVGALGFPVGSGPFLNLGMILKNEEAEKAGTPIDIVNATATNEEVIIDLAYNDVGWDLWDNWGDGSPEAFDPRVHKGTWIITALDSKGASVTTEPRLLGESIEMPFVDGVDVEKFPSGDLTVSWSAPELGIEIQEKCDIDYRIQLLQNASTQLYRSTLRPVPFVSVNAETLKERVSHNLDGIWVRVELVCKDKEQEGYKARSNTLFPLT